MSKKNNHHPYELPENIAHWQTNFSELKHKVVDYLKKHAPQENCPIVDAQHYLILNSHPANNAPNPYLHCASIAHDHSHTPYSHHAATHPAKPHSLSNQSPSEMTDSHIFKSKCKGSSLGAHGYHCEDDCRSGFPPICSLQLEKQQKKGKEDHREATLHEKLASTAQLNSVNDPLSRKKTSNNKIRYKSIEQTRSKPEGKGKARANSSLKRMTEQFERIKTYTENQKKNIFFIPVAQFLSEHQQAIDTTPMTPKESHVSLNPRNSARFGAPKTEGELPKPPSDVRAACPEEGEGRFTPLFEAKKEFHVNNHKRIYAHGKQHRQEINVLEKEIFEKFVFSPWQNTREEATIANLDFLTKDA